MGLMTELKYFQEKYIFTMFEDENEGFVYSESVIISHGITVWKKGRTYWVLRYPINVVISLTAIVCVLIHHIFNFRRYSFVAKMFDYAHPGAAIVYIITIQSQQSNLGRVAKALDKWYDYPFLEKAKNELKKNAEDKVRKFQYIYYNFMKLGSAAYCLMPIWHYYQYEEKDASNLLLFPCWSPLPLDTFWGFGITYLLELSTIINDFLLIGYIVTYLTAVAITAGYQCRLISTSLRTIDERVSNIMVLQNIGSGIIWAETLVWEMKRELRNCVIHYQRIYGLAKEVSGFFIVPISMCYYLGMFALVVCCGRVATERENMFLLFQAIFLAITILVNQYIMAFINQMITVEIFVCCGVLVCLLICCCLLTSVLRKCEYAICQKQKKYEELRVNVYESPWYKMKVPCRKMLSIIQSMVSRVPNIRTIFGTNADMEFFATVINASYCYLSALLSMNIKY